jgi:hypothetical protein
MRCRLTAPSPFAAFRKARPLASALFGLVTHLAAFHATNNPGRPGVTNVSAAKRRMSPGRTSRSAASRERELSSGSGRGAWLGRRPRAPGNSCFLAKEQPGRTPLRDRSLLSRTNGRSGRYATRSETPAAPLMSGRVHRLGALAHFETDPRASDVASGEHPHSPGRRRASRDLRSGRGAPSCGLDHGHARGSSLRRSSPGPRSPSIRCP